MKFVSDQANQFVQLIEKRQDEICSSIASIDEASFSIDLWDRPGGGGGNTRILTSETFEKAGVNSSQVFGQLKQEELPMFRQLIQKVEPDFEVSIRSEFFATGISLVIHPKNPFVPTVHANYRYFEVTNDHQSVWWMGGGADLTPYYLFDDDVTHFHSVHYNHCETFLKGSYDSFKSKCDEYFYLPHRQETRGVGGIFFDYLTDDYDRQFQLISSLSAGFVEAYIPIVTKRKGHSYDDSHRTWQAIRRGRYAEFNLLYDRGTLFGLKTNGRIESILMSMPPGAAWAYNHVPTPGSEEEKLLSVLRSPKHWIKK